MAGLGELKWLPTSFKNLVVVYREIGDGFEATIRTDAETRENLTQWLKEFEDNTKTRWLVQRSYPNNRQRFIAKFEFACHNSGKNERSTAKLRSRNWGCGAKITQMIRIVNRNTKKNDPLIQDGLPTVIMISNVHNHPTEGTEARHYPSAHSSLRKAFNGYFAKGMCVIDAMKYHSRMLKLSENTTEPILADASTNPTKKMVHYWYSVWKMQNRKLSKQNLRDKVSSSTSSSLPSSSGCVINKSILTPLKLNSVEVLPFPSVSVPVVQILFGSKKFKPASSVTFKDDGIFFTLQECTHAPIHLSPRVITKFKANLSVYGHLAMFVYLEPSFMEQIKVTFRLTNEQFNIESPVELKQCVTIFSLIGTNDVSKTQQLMQSIKQSVDAMIKKHPESSVILDEITSEQVVELLLNAIDRDNSTTPGADDIICVSTSEGDNMFDVTPTSLSTSKNTSKVPTVTVSYRSYREIRPGLSSHSLFTSKRCCPKFAFKAPTTSAPSTRGLTDTVTPLTRCPTTTVILPTRDPSTTVTPSTRDPTTTVTPSTRDPTTTVTPSTRDHATTVTPSTRDPSTTVTPSTRDSTTTVTPSIRDLSTTVTPSTRDPSTIVTPSTRDPTTTVTPSTRDSTTTVTPSTRDPTTTVTPSTRDSTTTVTPSVVAPITTAALSIGAHATVEPSNGFAITTTPPSIVATAISAASIAVSATTVFSSTTPIVTMSSTGMPTTAATPLSATTNHDLVVGGFYQILSLDGKINYFLWDGTQFILCIIENMEAPLTLTCGLARFGRSLLPCIGQLKIRTDHMSGIYFTARGFGNNALEVSVSTNDIVFCMTYLSFKTTIFLALHRTASEKLSRSLGLAPEGCEPQQKPYDSSSCDLSRKYLLLFITNINKEQENALKNIKFIVKEFNVFGTIELNTAIETLAGIYFGSTDKAKLYLQTQSLCSQSCYEQLIQMLTSNVTNPGPVSTADDIDDVIMTQEEIGIKCPYTQQVMQEPVRNRRCGHNYEKQAIYDFITHRDGNARCPYVGCANTEPLSSYDLEMNTELREYIKSFKNCS